MKGGESSRNESWVCRLIVVVWAIGLYRLSSDECVRSTAAVTGSKVARFRRKQLARAAFGLGFCHPTWSLCFRLIRPFPNPS
jgi:hypothetical protein